MIGMCYNESLDIVDIIFKDDIYLDDLLEFINNIRYNKHLPRKLRLLTDATKAHYKFSLNEIPTIIKSLSETKKYEIIKYAVIHAKPLETALSTILQKENTPLHFEHKVFSTRASAIEWLLLNSEELK